MLFAHFKRLALLLALFRPPQHQEKTAHKQGQDQNTSPDNGDQFSCSFFASSWYGVQMGATIHAHNLARLHHDIALGANCTHRHRRTRG